MAFWPLLRIIFSYNDKQLVLHFSGVWQKTNKGSVCFGAKNNSYGAFNMTKTGHVQAMKLVHRNGSIRCNRKHSATYWGCSKESACPKIDLMTIITKASGEALLPLDEESKDSQNSQNSAASCGKKRQIYSLERTSQNSSQLVFGNLSSPLSLLRNQELQIWYGQDWIDCSEDNNSGATCVDVYAWYIWTMTAPWSNDMPQNMSRLDPTSFLKVFPLFAPWRARRVATLGTRTIGSDHN